MVQGRNGGIYGGSMSELRDSECGLRCLGLPLPRPLVRFGDLGWGHLFGERITILCCFSLHLLPPGCTTCGPG